MFLAIDRVQDTMCGLAGGLHPDYRSEVTGKQSLGGGWWRIHGRLIDDMAKPEGSPRRPTLAYTVIAPGLQQYLRYRAEIYRRIQAGSGLVDVTIPMIQ